MSGVSTNTCSCMSVVPRSVVSTGPRTVSTVVITPSLVAPRPVRSTRWASGPTEHGTRVARPTTVVPGHATERRRPGGDHDQHRNHAIDRPGAGGVARLAVVAVGSGADR